MNLSLIEKRMDLSKAPSSFRASPRAHKALSQGTNVLEKHFHPSSLYMPLYTPFGAASGKLKLSVSSKIECKYTGSSRARAIIRRGLSIYPQRRTRRLFV